MPCETMLRPQQTEAQRRAEIDASLEELQRALSNGAVEIQIGMDGAVCFANWGEERQGVTDVCAFQTLQSRDSWELRQAVARAEMMSGRKVNQKAVAAGVHSHDGGQTWGKDS